MIYDRILVRYGELTIKGKNKKQFINHLNHTIINKLKKFPELEFIGHHERFYIILNGRNHHDVIEVLDKIFGLHSYSLAAKCETNLDDIKQLAVKVIKEEIKTPTRFKVETKRAFKRFPLTSLEVSKEVASHVLKNCDNLIVDVNHPEVTLNIEIREEATYITTKEYPGLGGLPVGMDGKGLLMLSGGIDSPVAGYLVQKRGVAIDVVHFSSPPYTSPQAKQKVLDLAERLARYSHNDRITVYNVPFTKLQKAIYQYCPSNYGITIMRRMMYRIAERIALKYNYLIIANGESIGQVASQTLQSLRAINEVTNMPIIRPCATLDKLEIINIANKIDTYDISILPYEDCCTIFVPDFPVIKPDLDKCRAYEKNFNYEELIEEALNNLEIIKIKAYERVNILEDADLSNLL